MIQQHLCGQLYKARVHAIYLELLLARTETIDRAIKMFLAVVSSSSIAGWVIWHEAQFAWAFLIAVSQVLNAIRPYLPYKERMKAFAALSREFEELAIHLEIKWLEVSSGELTEKEMRKLFADMLTKASSAEHKHFPNNSIPQDMSLLSKAEDRSLTYLRNYLSEGGQLEQ